MSEKIFLAGATGVIGRALSSLLVHAGYVVYGTTRKPDRAQALSARGVTPVLVDLFDAEGLAKTVREIAPTCIIHQVTDLPRKLEPSEMAEAVIRNAAVRETGTANLVQAASAAGCARMIAQSIAWAYAPGAEPHDESAALDTEATGSRATSVRGIVQLERAVLTTPSIHGTVLRYGHLYGPGTGVADPEGECLVHVEAAAWAALLAVRSTATGIFNIAEADGYVANKKAEAMLGWHPGLRIPAYAPEESA